MYSLNVHYTIDGNTPTHGEEQDPGRGDAKTYFVGSKLEGYQGLKLDWIALGK